MTSELVVDLSRLQFGLTALYHFLFVPLTLGMTFLLAIMESVYVMTGRQIYKDMVKFWGKLFGINFAMGVATGITLEFQFGTNWSYYSQFVGDVFGPVLAIEGLMAFFLEATFVGLFFFGWDRLTRIQHLVVTWLLAIGTSLSALWILVANGWMQHPVGAEFNYETMRMELNSFADVFLNPVAQVKFVHTVAAGYVTGSMFILGISAWYMLKGRDLPFARRSFVVAGGFGLASILSVILLGDESGYELGDVQKTKLAAIEAMWETEPPPASFTVVGLPDQERMETRYGVHVPYIMGVIATRSWSEKVVGIKELIEEHKVKIRNGMLGYAGLQEIRAGNETAAAREAYETHKKDIGYALLLKRYTPNVVDATDAQIDQAALDTIPRVAPLFWAFRIMVACGMFMLLIFVVSFYFTCKRKVVSQRWFLWVVVYSIPLPWIAAEAGWIVAEYGRQPWTVSGVLPTFLSASAVSVKDVLFSLLGLGLFYTALLVVELYLMFKYARLGPSSLGTGRYYHEREGAPAAEPSDSPTPSELSA